MTRPLPDTLPDNRNVKHFLFISLITCHNSKATLMPCMVIKSNTSYKQPVSDHLSFLLPCFRSPQAAMCKKCRHLSAPSGAFPGNKIRCGSLRLQHSPRYSGSANGRVRNTAAEGAIHPETLRQKDRSRIELWRAALASGKAPTDGAGCYSPMQGGSRKISQVHGQGGELETSSPLFCFCHALRSILAITEYDEENGSQRKSPP